VRMESKLERRFQQGKFEFSRWKYVGAQ
jgi:hypothetical protein